jgi:hypothetical protein
MISHDQPSGEEAAPAFPEGDRPHGEETRLLPPAAQRALAEAEARRRARREAPATLETGGRAGPEPTRYGDWEKGGIASDF